MDEFVYERKKMNKKLRKTIRLTAISLGALLTVFLLAVTIVVNFIFTPEKLTPVVLNVANQSLNARLQMKSVELTFFSTFPRFGLKVTGLQPLAFTALHFTLEDLDPGLTRKLQHTVDVIPQKNVCLHVDLKQRGLGGDNSWGMYPHNEYRLLDKKYSYSYKLQLVDGE